MFPSVTRNKTCYSFGRYSSILPVLSGVLLIFFSIIVPACSDEGALSQDGQISLQPKSGALGERAMKLTRAGLLILPLDALLMKALPRKTQGGRNDFVTSTANRFGTPEILLPALGGLYMLGDRRDKDTAKMALAALVNASIITDGVKILAGRGRPNSVLEAGEFQGIGQGSSESNYSFPSGHTSAAFAVATVLANRHPKHRLLYYGMAVAVGAARLHSSAHFPSDVLVGAGVGTYAGKQALTRKLSLLSWKIRF